MTKILLGLLVLFLPTATFAHGGGLDASVCHNDRKRGGYHCHRGASIPKPRFPTVRRATPPPLRSAIEREGPIELQTLRSAATSAVQTSELPEPIVGVPQVLDGDTIQIGASRVRLFGIDAFEGEQMCEGTTSVRYGCGGRATRALADLIAGETAVCVPKGIDAFGRQLAVCRVGAVDLSSAMAREGHALAYVRYARDYVFDESVAKAKRAGAGNGSLVPPWEYRLTRRSGGAEAQRTAEAPSADCTIKGNFNAKGDRIYHLAGSREYARTKPENRFCSVDEAERAGFRASGKRR